MAHHEALGEILAAFEGRTLLRRADDEDGVGLEIVIYACYQRVFVADDNHVDGVIGDKAAYCFEIERREVDIGAVGTCAAVAGSDEKRGSARALGNFPGESGLSAARAEKKDVER